MGSSASNVIVALTNIPAVMPLWNSLQRGDHLTAACVGFAACASFVSHLFEAHKHGNVGFGCTPAMSRWLNYADRLAVGVLASRVVYLLARNKRQVMMIKIFAVPLCCALALNLASEHDKDSKRLFVVLHSAWHLSAFFLLDAFLSFF